MEFSLIDILAIIGSLGLFIFGIKTASESIQKASGNFLSRMLNVMTKNKFSGIFTGFLLTSIIFSSSSTIVMVVSFVNSGLITLVESVSIMLGADIGTTIITWIVSVFGFDQSLSYFFIFLFAIGTPLIFSSKNKLKYVGEFIFGVALLFLGLSLIIKFVPTANEALPIFEYFKKIIPLDFIDNIFFVMIGVILTLALQSSVAAIVLTQVLCFNGLLPFEIAIPLVLGQNFGRTINAELAAMSANVHAKRTARIHSLINIFGFTWMIIVLSTFPIVEIINSIGVQLFSLESVYLAKGAPIGIAIFHSLFNIINTFILVWFIPQLVKLATNNIKSKGETDEKFHLEHLSTGILLTPDVSIFEAQKEIAKFGEIVKRMNGFLKNLIKETETNEINVLLLRIKKYEDITDRIEQDVADYLAKISQGEMNENSSIRIRGMLRIIVNLERIGDIYYQMSKGVERKNQQKTYFTPEQRTKLLNMFDLVELALDNMNQNLNSYYDNISLDKARELENNINQYRKILRKEHFESVEKGEYNFASATIYSDLFNSLEKVGDHIINVSEGVTGEH
ncbi:MAG: Na/Pi cotransporter [Flavobacteriales bacterium CG_4_10_14_0_2_um_filter_32_8]|nr:MAG: Na/Pi cotransporter [Flavobacteriales bacterium CG_4_10_14_0_2_um_filter_32_8]PJB14754.1 MAG: Na/Pi cotransporter [Flavobacteriales bacterium CG_4_9_14_3_um_filter_32_8]